MKKFIFILFLTGTVALQGQTIVSKQTVSVTGNAMVKRALKGYKAKITLSLDEAYYAYPECTSIEELTSKYFSKLKDEGFNSGLLEASKFQFSTYGIQKGSTTFLLETTSLSDIEKLARVKMNGINAQYSAKYTLSQKAEEDLFKAALKNAEQRAMMISEASGKKLGDIISISEFIPAAILWKTYHQDFEEYAKVSVVYELR